jgi:serine/threonine protein kinase
MKPINLDSKEIDNGLEDELESEEKIPEIKTSQCSKTKQSKAMREKSSEARSEINIQTPEGTSRKVYLEHNLSKQYPEGITARVKKVFDDNGNPIGAVKIFKSPDGSQNEYYELLAKKETKIAGLLPDRSEKVFCVQNSPRKWYVFMPWFQGEILDNFCKKFKEEKTANLPISVCLTLMQQAFKQMKPIHDADYALYDKFDDFWRNIIISIEDQQLYLIDFAFAKPNAPLSSKKNDIRDLGIISRELLAYCVGSKDLSDMPSIFKKIGSSDLLILAFLMDLLGKMGADENYIPNIEECLIQIEKIITINQSITTFIDKINALVSAQKYATYNIDQAVKICLKDIKAKLSTIYDPTSQKFRQINFIAKKVISGEANKRKQQVRITPIEELLSENSCRFSWSAPPIPVSTPTIKFDH